MAKKKIVEFELELEAFLLGIATYERIYKTAWKFNHLLDLDFERLSDHEVVDMKKQSSKSFIVYSYWEADNELQYFLIENKHYGGVLIPELKQFDYILMIEGDLFEKHKKILTDKIRKAVFIQTILEVDISKLKFKENLLIDGIHI